MNIEKSKDGGRLTLKVAGRLDTNTSPELESELKFDGVSEAVFDFSGLEYISSAGLRVLMAAHKAMAVTIMCGLAFATVLTMVVIPVNYALIYRIRRQP